jgi:hypothetical protein
MTYSDRVIESALLVQRRLAASSLYVMFKLTIITKKYSISQMLSSSFTTILKAI